MADCHNRTSPPETERSGSPATYPQDRLLDPTVPIQRESLQARERTRDVLIHTTGGGGLMWRIYPPGQSTHPRKTKKIFLWGIMKILNGVRKMRGPF